VGELNRRGMNVGNILVGCLNRLSLVNPGMAAITTV